MQCQAQGKAQTGVRAVGWAAIATLMPETSLVRTLRVLGKQKEWYGGLEWSNGGTVVGAMTGCER
jgi:hypothetical protein